MVNQAESVKTKAAMRAVPQQTRSHQRVKKILDTAEKLFAQVGYEVATTNEIAAQAHVSIGSFYQYFPNKEAILRALVQRYQSELRIMYDYLLTSEVLGLSLSQVIDRLINVHVEFTRSHHNFVQITFQPQPAAQLSPDFSELYQDRIHLLEAILSTQMPQLDPEKRKLYATIGLTAVSALLSKALELNLAGERKAARQIVEEAKILLLSYFQAVITK